MNILLAFLLLLNAAFLTTFLLFCRRLNNIVSQFRSFAQPAGDNQPSPLANVTQVAADMVGRSICASLKATFMGRQSGDSRAIQAIAGDIVEDNLAKSQFGTVLTAFPTLKKTLRRNPGLLDLAMSMLNNPGNARSSSGSSGDGQMTMELK